MNLLVKARRTTAVCERAADISSVKKWLYENDQVKIVNQKKVGLNTYYITDDGFYVNAKDLAILRDNEFYYNNYSSRKLMRNNLNTVGGNGLETTIDNSSSDLTPTYNFLQLFGSSTSTTSVVTRSELVSGSTEMARGTYGGAPNQNRGGIIPVPPTQQPRNYDNAILNQNIGGMVGGNETVGKLLNGVSIGSVLDGSFVSRVGANAYGLLSGMLGKWSSGLLEYVVGFGSGSGLTNLFRQFGLNFETLFGRGINASGWLDALGGGTNYGFINNLFANYIDPSRSIGGSSAVDERFREYFRYKGSNGQFIIHTFGNEAWERPAYYDTSQMKTSKSGYPDETIQVINNIWNYDNAPIEDPMKKIREEFNLDVDRQTIVTKFNRFRVPTPDNELIGTRGHIFFSQPDLNLNFSANVAGVPVNYASRIGDLSKKLLECHPILMKYLCSGGTAGNHSLIPIFTHACTGIDVADDVLEYTEHGETYMGWKQLYGTSNIKSKTAGTLSIKFTDDNELSIFKMIKLWVEYINAVYHGEIEPKEKYKLTHQLDYAISIYYIVTKHDDSEIAFWTKYTGAFPTSVPSSTFSDTLGQRLSRPEYSITWAFARKEDYRPLHLAEFNNLTADAGPFTYLPTYNPETTHVNRSFTGAPYVEAYEDGRFYRLRFRPDDGS